MSNSLFFGSADQAAVHALDHVMQKSIKEQWEYSGYIFKVGDRFCFDDPLRKSSEPKGGVMPPVPPLPRGGTLVATMHTHPFDEDFYAEEGDITTITKPDRFSQDKDVPGRIEFERRWKATHPTSGFINMYVLDIHGEVNVLEGKRTGPATDRVVRPATDLTGI